MENQINKVENESIDIGQKIKRILCFESTKVYDSNYRK